MESVRSRLSYANVMSTIAVFFVLGGATAFAAKALAPNSVGPKQLQQEAVTRAKIRSGAVSAAKLADGAVSAGKIGAGAVGTDNLANGSVTADKLAVALPSFGVVHRLLATSTVAAPSPKSGVSSVIYPLDNPSFTQPIGEDDLLIGAVTARFEPKCKAPRHFTAYLQMDDPGALNGFKVLAIASADDEKGTEEVKTAQFGAIERGPLGLLALGAPAPRKLSIKLVTPFCGTGSPTDATASAIGAQVDVIGIR